MPAVPAVPAGKEELQQITPTFTHVDPGSPFRDILANSQEQLAQDFCGGNSMGDGGPQHEHLSTDGTNKQKKTQSAVRSVQPFKWDPPDGF